MSKQSAAGRKTEILTDRCDRVAAGVESLFQRNTQIVEDCFATVAQNRICRDYDMQELAAFLKISAQLAGQIARLETVKNRNSKAQ